MSAWFKTKAVTKVQNVTQPVGSSGTDPRRCTAAPCYKIKSLLRRILCLILCVSLLFSASAPKAEAVVAESAIAIGAIACLILMSVGVVFNPKTQEDLVAIGQNFQSYMYQWGTEAQKLDEVEEMFNGLHLIDPDDDGDWSPNKTKITLARTLLTGISLWCSSIVLNYKPIGGLSSQTTPQGYVNFNGLTSEKSAYWNWDDYLNRCEFPFFDFLRYCGLYGYALPIAFTRSGCAYMFYFDESGLLHLGYFTGVFNSFSASNFTLVSVADCMPHLTEAKNSPSVYFSEELAKNHPDFDSIECYVLDWDTLCSQNVIDGTNQLRLNVYKKESQNLSFGTTSETISFNFYSGTTGYWVGSYKQYLLTSWEGVTAHGVISPPEVLAGSDAEKLKNDEISPEQLPIYDLDISQALAPGTPVLESIQTLGDWLTSNELTLEEYQTMTKGAADPVWEKSIEFGSSITYQQNAVADPIEVLASADDKGEILYEWHMYGQDADGNNFSALPIGEGLSIIPSTAEPGTYYYYCKAMNRNLAGYYSHPIYTHTLTVTVTPTSVEPDPAPDPEPGVDPDPAPDPEPGVDSDLSGDIAAGEDFVGQLTDMIPNYSEGFAAALSDFASKFSYEGTEAVLTIPAIVTPEIPGPSGNEPLLKSHLLLAEQQIDFEESSKVIPEIVLLLVQCLLTVALILFCCKELYDVIAYILTLRREA